MNPTPRHGSDYSERQIEAAHRVLVDLGQVLASFADYLVVIGGWVPDLLIPVAEESHIGSIDVDLALDAEKMEDENYADIHKLILDTNRYTVGEKAFQLLAHVDLADGQPPVQVEVEFLAPGKMKHHANRFANFHVLRNDGCAAAFNAPVEREIVGTNVDGALNTVRLRIASMADFLVMKANAMKGRDKPKDAYDLCYCLEHYPPGMQALAEAWKTRRSDRFVKHAISVLVETFSSMDAYGPRQIVAFHDSSESEVRTMQARRAYELVQKFLTLVGESALER